MGTHVRSYLMILNLLACVHLKVKGGSGNCLNEFIYDIVIPMSMRLFMMQSS